MINNKEYVSQSKRERVLRTMEKLGYVVNMQARSLAGGRTQVIGLLIHAIDNAYSGAIMKGIDIEVGQKDYNLMLYTTHRQKAKESAFVTQLTRNVVDGLLLVLPRNAEAYLETLHKRRFPFVLVDHQWSSSDMPVPSVSSTNWKGAYEATAYLLQLGHRRIGFITGSMDMTSAQDRLAGYKAALQEHGLPWDTELVYEGDFAQLSGYNGANTLLSVAEPPTAIFASNDFTAFGVMDAARERGLHIPRDISIIGFDDVFQAEHVRPALTTVRQPIEEMGRCAVRLLLKYIEQPESPVEQIELSTTLIQRESCQAPDR